MKKILLVALAVVMVFALASCGSKKAEPAVSEAATQAAVESTAPAESAAASVAPAESAAASVAPAKSAAASVAPAESAAAEASAEVAAE